MIRDYPTVEDGDPGNITIPLEHEEVRIASALPHEAKRELVRNVKEYIKQLGRDYDTTQPLTSSAIRL